jgi:hypothetical protein
LLAIGTLDKLGRPWTTVWGGEPGFAGPVAESVIGVRNVVDAMFDPVVEALLDGKDRVVSDGDGPLMAGLPIDLENRKRVKLAGRVVATSMERAEEETGASSESTGQVQVIIKITESMGM